MYPQHVTQALIDYLDYRSSLTLAYQATDPLEVQALAILQCINATTVEIARAEGLGAAMLWRIK